MGEKKIINKIWFSLIVLGILCAFFSGSTQITIDAITVSAKSTIELIIALAGFLCFWNGMLNIAEKSGLTKSIAKLLNPIFMFLFKKEGREEKALGAIVMNLTSNMFGISNAATPFGIKAMEEMQKNNPIKDRATNDMVLFLVMNAACIQIIPTTIISIRSAASSTNPTFIILPAILSTSIAAIVGICSCKILERYF